ncbi:hypothetical protein QVD17_20011 [Tagetes erecta]|uniref:Uncharacterized protein n=1 Tax=Tagetes erecta TaxID=13708 RepID=A0AAD8KP41_TARER|nr:hypothetical protein QVD17_20011 [Tagetes erecta]
MPTAVVVVERYSSSSGGDGGAVHVGVVWENVCKDGTYPKDPRDPEDGSDTGGPSGSGSELPNFGIGGSRDWDWLDDLNLDGAISLEEEVGEETIIDTSADVTH